MHNKFEVKSTEQKFVISTNFKYTIRDFGSIDKGTVREDKVFVILKINKDLTRDGTYSVQPNNSTYKEFGFVNADLDKTAMNIAVCECIIKAIQIAEEILSGGEIKIGDQPETISTESKTPINDWVKNNQDKLSSRLINSLLAIANNGKAKYIEY